jgi:arylsulfatase A-like enzyme
MPREIPVRVARWLVWLPVLLACGAPLPEPPNFLVLSIDTLRADHLGSYGYLRRTSPNLDAFAAGALRYANAYAPAPWTLPSHVGILTGRHPYAVGIVDVASSIPAGVSPLAALLSGAGYQTAAFVDSGRGGLLGAARGFARGFDVFRHAPHTNTSDWEYDMASTVDAGLAWLARRDPERRFLLFLHTKSVHTTPADPVLLARTDAPYDKPDPFRTLFVPGHRVRFAWSEGPQLAGVNYLRALNDRIARGEFDRDSFTPERLEELVGLYDGGIYYVDHHFRRLIAGLDELGLGANTVVIVTADHGEAFLEHVFFLHKELYTGLLHVPLILRDPRDPRSGVVERRVSLLDVAPTVLALAGLEIPADLDGRVLPRDDDEPGDERPFFSYFEFERDHVYHALSLDEGPWKLVHHKLAAWPEYRTELYDTRADPEQRAPIEGEGERQREMLARLLAWARDRRGSEDTIEIDAESAEQLRALGYLK